MKQDKGHKMKSLHMKIQEHSSLRENHNKKFGLYFKCDERVLNRFEKKNEELSFKNSFRLSHDEQVLEYMWKLSISLDTMAVAQVRIIDSCRVVPKMVVGNGRILKSKLILTHIYILSQSSQIHKLFSSLFNYSI